MNVKFIIKYSVFLLINLYFSSDLLYNIQRKNIIISGIKKIVSFDDKQFLLESNMGNIFIKGSNLEMIKLDTIDGNVSIKGTIDSFVYAEDKKVGDSIITKLFK